MYTGLRQFMYGLNCHRQPPVPNRTRTHRDRDPDTGVDADERGAEPRFPRPRGGRPDRRDAGGDLRDRDRLRSKIRVLPGHPANNIQETTAEGGPRRKRVGTVKVTIGVGDPQGRQFEDVEVVVDTGLTYTAVPRELLQRLGVPVERSLPSETADGRLVPVDVGRTTIRLEGLEFSTPVIFAEEGEPSLLGVVSLEQAALAVDPLAGRLIPANLLRF